MVARQLAARGIRHQGVLEAMARVPRHYFVPWSLRGQAYDDHPLRIGMGQTISQPYMVARMTELLDPEPAERILEIGTGSGYQAAVLSMLAGEVVTIERHERLLRKAAARLREAGCVNVIVQQGDGTRGCPEWAPYDAILVTAGAPRIPKELTKQLAVGGRMVCPVGTREEQVLMVVEQTETELVVRESISCVFVPLIGEEGWAS